MAKKDGKGLLARLIKTLKIKSKHPWQQFADLIRDCGGIADATCGGFTVHLVDGIREVEFEGGLTDDHYFYFAPLLDDLDKTILAQGVLRNKVGRQSFIDQETTWELLRLKYGDHEEAWLPQRVAIEGFALIANELKEALTEYRKDHPVPRLKTWTFESPRFNRNSGFLYWGGHQWHFRKQPGAPVWESLCAFEDQGYPHLIKLTFLKQEQVHEARRGLQERTQPIIEWHESADCCLSWEVS